MFSVHLYFERIRLNNGFKHRCSSEPEACLCPLEVAVARCKIASTSVVQLGKIEFLSKLCKPENELFILMLIARRA